VDPVEAGQVARGLSRSDDIIAGHSETTERPIVGDIDSVATDVLRTQLDNGLVPVISPLSADESGTLLNINADTVAGKMAEALLAEKLILLTNTTGILDQSDELITSVGVREVDAYIADGTISGGMLPKVRCALDAVHCGVGSATILDGRVEHAVLLEMFTASGIGTMISRKQTAN
jgi:acetylglutamate kinase